MARGYWADTTEINICGITCSQSVVLWIILMGGSLCHTCKSRFEYSKKRYKTKLKKISNIKRSGYWLTFGFASKVAQSQFECENCEYKW